MTGPAGIVLAALLLGVPLAIFALWPLWGRSGRPRTFLPLGPDPREPLLEQKRQALRALRELAFEHEAGHVSDDDYAELRARYEAEAARVLTALDRLGAPPAPPEPTSRPAAAGWRHPLALAGMAVALVVFGIALGVGIARHAAPDPTAGLPMPGSRPLATLPSPGPASQASGEAGPRPVSPEMLRGMLQAAQTSLAAGRYGEAVAAYNAVLAREPGNVDALAHRALVMWMGGHDVDQALAELGDALARDPNYAPALFYQGFMLYKGKQDSEGAIRSWERFLTVAPAGEDHERVRRLIAEARARR
jgi:tetratricopeptide (TPR) repeat protein